jgi:hypothetical protein
MACVLLLSKLDGMDEAIPVAHQRLKRPLLSDSAVASQDDYAISLPNNIRAVMSSHEDCKTMCLGYARGAEDRSSNMLKGIYVQPAEDVVQHQNRDSRIERSCEGKTLLLSAAQGHAFVAYRCLLSNRKSGDVDRQCACVYNRVVPNRVIIGLSQDNVPDRIIEQLGFLRAEGE